MAINKIKILNIYVYLQILQKIKKRNIKKQITLLHVICFV